MAEERNVFNTTLLVYTLKFQTQTDEAFMVDGHKHTHTHTHTHTHIHESSIMCLKKDEKLVLKFL